MIETYGYDELKALGGHQVAAEDGAKVGYIDLVFRDHDTGAPEWLGIWDGLPDSKPRVLVPVQGVSVEADVVRVPWSAEQVRSAPAYEVPGDLAIGHDSVVEISPETERAAYEHYGVDPSQARDESATVVRFRIWRIQELN
jgi:hypothetical protein